MESLVQGLLLPCILCQDDNEKEILICQCHISKGCSQTKFRKIFIGAFVHRLNSITITTMMFRIKPRTQPPF